MPEDTDKDSFVSLFEPMSLEALDRQSQNFPLNESLSPQGRKEAIDWLLNPKGGGVSVNLVEKYNDPVYRQALIASILLHPWFAPSKDLSNRIVLKGTSAHHVNSATIPLTLAEEPQRKVDVVIKPSQAGKARIFDELKRLEKLQARGIPTIEPCGVIEVNDSMGHASYLLTVLRRGIVPLQKINFEQLRTEHRDIKMKQFTEVMEGIASLVAKMHNNGVVHGDLFLRNIAINVTQDSPDDFILFDLERSTILREAKLDAKNKLNHQHADPLPSTFKDFEDRALDDLVSLSADIAVKNDHIKRTTIFKHLIQPYIEARTASHGQYPDVEYLNLFNERFNVRLGKLEKSADFERKHTNNELIQE